MASTRVLAVVAVLVLAGCGAVTEEPDREPYGVNESVDPEPEELLPGLTEDEVTDADRLNAAHSEALEGEAYELRHVRVDREEDGTVDHQIETVQTVSENGSPAYRLTEYGNVSADENRTDNSLEHIETWADGETAYLRTVTASGDVSYREESEYQSFSADPPVRMDQLYDATETVEPIEDGRVELSASDVAVDRLVENATFTVVLAESGYVERYDLRGTSVRGDPLHTEQAFALETLDEPEIEEPEWLEEAEREAEADE